MNIKQEATAGTLESSDVLVQVTPGTQGIEIELTSSVEKQFGRQIRQVIAETAAEEQIDQVHIKVIDKGALDCTLRARVRAALQLAKEDPQ